ncbi:MAG: DUF4956 domain-containing protein [Oscillospiraceae bacterium]|nr:DUF4956 domain-containing protein [Oscillospiraceae bacterium]
MISLMSLREIFGDILSTPQQLEALTGQQVLINLSVAFICGIAIFLVYRYFNTSVVYSVRFNMLIVMVCVVTSLIIITIGTNLVLTLGMVGALSIVRFRAAVKDPLDVGFLFWGVAVGLTAGAQLYTVALIGTGFIAIVYIVLTLVRLEKHSYLLIVRYKHESEEAVKELLKPLNTRVKNKTTNQEYSETTAQVRVRAGDTSFVDKIRETDGVNSVTLVEYTGDYA